jgi:hypothetical protein
MWASWQFPEHFPPEPDQSAEAPSQPQPQEAAVRTVYEYPPPRDPSLPGWAHAARLNFIDQRIAVALAKECTSREIRQAWRCRRLSAQAAKASVSADSASGLGSGRFSAAAALCNNLEQRPNLASQSGTVIAVNLTKPGVFTSFDRRRMTCPTTSSTAISHVSRSVPAIDLTDLRHSSSLPRSK